MIKGLVEPKGAALDRNGAQAREGPGVCSQASIEPFLDGAGTASVTLILDVQGHGGNIYSVPPWCHTLALPSSAEICRIHNDPPRLAALCLRRDHPGPRL